MALQRITGQTQRIAARHDGTGYSLTGLKGRQLGVQFIRQGI